VPNFLAAAKLARHRGVTLRCFLVGAELECDNEALMDEMRRIGCCDFVVALGPRADLRDIARAVDLHVLASCGAEAFPNVVAETMLSGTPNAVTDVGDAALMVADTGWIIPPRNTGRLADAIISAYLEWKEEAAKWGSRREACRRQIAGNFSFERMAQAYAQVWRTVAPRATGHSNE
jgi:glycosyltransferase involved in cell wall biosynthesis